MVAEGVFAGDCLRTSNAIRAHEPQVVLLLGCTAEIRAELGISLPPVATVEMQDIDAHVLAAMPGYRQRPLAGSNFRDRQASHAHVVAVEGNDSMALVIAQNLAIAQGSSVFGMPPLSKDQVDEALEWWRIWGTQNGTDKEDAQQALLGFLRRQLGPLVTAAVGSISFFTRGLPYSLYPFTCPTTHHFSFPLLGESVLGGMMTTLRPRLRCPVVVLIDPASVQARESLELGGIFGRAGYLIRGAIASDATTQNAHYLTEHLPSDFLFYSTHCGEVRGTRITEEFRTADGKNHLITYELVKQLAPGQQPDRVEVLDLRRWLSLDGVAWSNSAGKEKMGAASILREFLELCRQRRGDVRQMRVVDSQPVEFVRFSDALGMHDGDIYVPMPQNIGGYHRPVVFNNACSSWRELAPRFVGHGASIYIGTSFDVLDSVAFSVGCSFAKDAAAGRSLGHALYRAQKSFVTELGYKPYLMNGYLFTTCRKLRGTDPIPAIVRSRLQQAVLRHAADKRDDPAHRWQVDSIQAFLQREIELLSKT
jgi:hypothetical protein